MTEGGEKSQPIYIIKKIIRPQAHHGGAWKVAYADFVTAMMAFFMVLWLLSSSEQVKQAVGGYFSDPEGSGKMMGTEAAGAGGDAISVSVENMEKMKEALQQTLKEIPQYKKVKNQVKMIISGEGLRIEFLESEVGTFFQSGSPVPTEQAVLVLGKMAQEIGRLPNKIFLEGHTDATPFSGEYSNWELSVDRANTARRIVQAYGVRPDQVAQVRGFADQSPRVAERPDDPSNRRISLIIKHLDKARAKKADPPPASAVPSSKPHG